MGKMYRINMQSVRNLFFLLSNDKIFVATIWGSRQERGGRPWAVPLLSHGSGKNRLK